MNCEMECTAIASQKEETRHEQADRKINEMEQTKVRLMRTLVEREDPASKEVDDSTIRRFLRARDLNIEKASAMFLKYLKWRRAFVPNGSISLSQVTTETAQNKVFLQGSDKNGQPIVVLIGARYFQNKGNLDELQRFVVYCLDNICASIPAGLEKFVAVVDLQGWGYANSDIRGYLAALSILQDYYPERLGKLLIVRAPYIFMSVWKAIYPFMDNNTRKKIEFVENKKLKSALLEEIDESQIPEIYGGKLPLVPIHEV